MSTINFVNAERMEKILILLVASVGIGRTIEGIKILTAYWTIFQFHRYNSEIQNSSLVFGNLI